MDKSNQALAQAKHHLRLGNFPAVIRCCEPVLSGDPHHGEALELTGLAYVNSGHAVQGIAHLRQAVSCRNGHVGSMVNLAAALVGHGQGEEAVTLLRTALERHGDSPHLHFNLAAALQAVKDAAGAEACYRQSVRLQPDFAEAHNNLGLVLDRQARYAEAVHAFQSALAIRPDYLRAWSNLGNTRRKMRHFTAAAHDLSQALARNPSYLPALCNLAQVHFDQEDYQIATALFGRACAAQPQLALAHLGRARSLAAQERHSEALVAYDGALAVEPKSAEAWNARGLSLVRLGHHAEAIASYHCALEILPNYASAAWNLALVHLTLRDFRAGWPRFEARFEVEGLQATERNFTMPQWRGELPLTGTTVWVHAEYGLGDTIQFCRYLPLLEQRGAKVLFEVPHKLRRLLTTLMSPDALIDTGCTVHAADWHCPLLSLPLAFSTEADSIPSQVPYLAADPALVSRWAARLAGRRSLRIGIAWKGNAEADRRGLKGRRIPLGAFRALLRIPQAHLYSLQKDVTTEEVATADLGDRLILFGEELDSGNHAFVDTAALMTLMDVVVTLDTSVAHLAGALAVPVYLALHTQADWRWHLDGSTTPWYPTMRLFRQSTAGDWSGVFDEIASEAALLATR